MKHHVVFIRTKNVRNECSEISNQCLNNNVFKMPTFSLYISDLYRCWFISLLVL